MHLILTSRRYYGGCYSLFDVVWCIVLLTYLLSRLLTYLTTSQWSVGGVQSLNLVSQELHVV